MRKYELNENYFKEINDPNKAYILGFIYADGSINRKNNQLTITIKKDDEEILLNIISEIYLCDRPIKYYRGYSRLVISSKIIITYLKSTIDQDLNKYRGV